MADADNALAPSKKRAAGREISRDNPGLDDDEDTPEQETGTFKRAPEEVLANRRIVKVRRQPTPAAASSNPFAGVCLIPRTTESTAKCEVTSEAHPACEKPVAEEVDSGAEKEVGETEINGGDKKLENKQESEPSVNEKNDVPVQEAADPEVNSEKEAEKKDKENKQESESSVNEKNDVPVQEAADTEVNNEKEAEKKDKENNGQTDVDPSDATATLSSFQQLSSTQNAFTGISGTGFSTSSFSFGSIPKDGSAIGTSSGSLFALKNDKPPAFPSFNFGNSSNGSSLFGTTGATDTTKSEGGGPPTMQEVPVETGEENETAVFTVDAVLFEYLDGGWKERGKGELKVNVCTTGVERARLVMRARGNYRLILNASLYADMKIANMDKRGVTFACMNSTGDGKEGLSTFALKFKDASVVEEFRTIVTAHKGKKTTVLKTPENSPKASDD